MSIAMFMFWTSCVVLFIVPPYFVWNKVYKDGIIGRGALLAISFTASTFLLQAIATDFKCYEVLPQTIAFVVSFAVFLVWHLFRFHTRIDVPQSFKENI